MGLDTVEIVLRIEETFGVDLPDDELGSVSTVGDLYKLLLSRLDGSYACLSSRAFYRVRRSMVTVLGVPRRSIRPSTELQPLLGNRRSVERWRQVESLAALQFPRLEHPRWFRRATLWGSVSLYLCACFVLMSGHFRGESALISGAQALATLFVLGVIFVPLAAILMRLATPFMAYAAPMPTVGRLARVVLANNYAEFSEGVVESKKLDHAEVWRVLQGIIVDQLQTEPEDVVLEAHFGRDLGCD
jgi:acyl carrier protein